MHAETDLRILPPRGFDVLAVADWVSTGAAVTAEGLVGLQMLASGHQLMFVIQILCLTVTQKQIYWNVLFFSSAH